MNELIKLAGALILYKFAKTARRGTIMSRPNYASKPVGEVNSSDSFQILSDEPNNPWLAVRLGDIKGFLPRWVLEGRIHSRGQRGGEWDRDTIILGGRG